MNPDGGPDPVDAELLQHVQDDFPLEIRPYRTIGERLGISEEEVIDRLASLHRRGILKHIAPILEMHRIGIGASTLVAMRVADGRVDEVAGIASGYPGVSHNYLRDHDYNLWFTLADSSRADLGATLEEISRRSGIGEEDLLDLPVVQRFKIDVRFRFVPDGGDGHGRY